MKKRREYIFYLQDMHASMVRIADYIKDSDFNAFHKNLMMIDAVIRNLEIIGEAAQNVPEEIRNKYPEIPWKKMYGLRNVVIHEYFGIDHEMIWEISKNNLPKNEWDLKNIIEKEQEEKDR